MAICCIHLKGQDPFRVNIAGYRVDPVGSLELVAPTGSSFGTYAPGEWSFIHVPEVPGWPCALDEADTASRAATVGKVVNMMEGEE